MGRNSISYAFHQVLVFFNFRIHFLFPSDNIMSMQFHGFFRINIIFQHKNVNKIEH